jgi:dihydroorotase-like cyclic amidohydrolase
MPNNAEPITTPERLAQKIKISQSKTVSDIGFHYGSLGDNLETFDEVKDLVTGLKLYLNKTTGGYLLDTKMLKKIYKAWPKEKIILLHAEEDVIDVALESLKGLSRPIHVCHMPSREILQKIIDAKKAGMPVTCGVCAHHLFLNEEDAKKLGVYGRMLPSLKSKADQDFLRNNLEYIDLFESDHAPHTRQEKIDGVFGIPGLETTLPLLLTAEKQGLLTREQLIDKCHTTPAKLFELETDANTYTEVEMGEFIIRDEDQLTKCGWSSFNGRTVNAKVIRTVLRGKTVFEKGKILAAPGSGKVLLQ